DHDGNTTGRAPEREAGRLGSGVGPQSGLGLLPARWSGTGRTGAGHPAADRAYLTGNEAPGPPFGPDDLNPTTADASPPSPCTVWARQQPPVPHDRQHAPEPHCPHERDDDEPP